MASTTVSTSTAPFDWAHPSIPISRTDNALYDLPTNPPSTTPTNPKPWRTNPHHFTSVLISSLALLKMTTHARSGGPLEVMGLMLGYVSGPTFIVTDAFRLPVEGTETRVNAQDEANEYMVNYLTFCREGGGRPENAVGWYHSHPGYGCWLSGIDVQTQAMQQSFQDPFVAVVVDPDRTVAGGKVEIGAFRTFPKDYKPPSTQALGWEVGVDADGYQTIPSEKMGDFGAHAGAYYSLDVGHFKSTVDASLLGTLWEKYWVKTLAATQGGDAGREYVGRQIEEQGVKVREAARKVREGKVGRIRELAPGKDVLVQKDATIEGLVKAGDTLAAEELAGELAGEVKRTLFWGVVEEARQKDQTVFNGEEGVRET